MDLLCGLYADYLYSFSEMNKTYKCTHRTYLSNVILRYEIDM